MATGSPKPTKFLLLKEWENPQNITDIRDMLTTYDVFVPVIGRQGGLDNFVKTRTYLFDAGVYPGVEYRIVGIHDADDTRENFPDIPSRTRSLPQGNNLTSIRDSFILVRPVYPLIPALERDWPVSIQVSTIPRMLSRGMYNTLTVMASAALASSFLFAAVLVSQTITFRCRFKPRIPFFKIQFLYGWVAS